MDRSICSTALSGVPHGFSTRSGETGISGMPDGPWVRLQQVHSADVVVVETPWDHKDAPKADALVTKRSGFSLAIVTADCAPVLLADAQAGVVGAAHAGWRGAVGGVLEATVAAMVALGARTQAIVAAIGPTIGQASYEVDAAFRENFPDGDAGFFETGRSGHWQFDLPAYVATRLRSAGVGAVDDLALDTYADPERFYSYRRATHLREDTGGRQISVIALPGRVA